MIAKHKTKHRHSFYDGKTLNKTQGILRKQKHKSKHTHNIMIVKHKNKHTKR